MTKADCILILGAGQAAVACAAALRRGGFAGEITLAGDEPHAPYQRPPLSKAALRDGFLPESLALRSADWYAAQNITLRTRLRALSIDRAARKVRFTDGSSLPWDRLVLATGSQARPLPAEAGGDLAGVLSLRSLADAERLRAALARAEDLVIIGGGYIGLEIAAVARSMEKRVTLLERDGRILSRVAAPETSAWVQALHESHGLRILTRVAGFTPEAEAGRIRGLHLPGGERVVADLVVAGIGSLVETGLATQAGLQTGGGAVLCDAQGRTSDPDIFAIGDCADFDLGGPAPLRLESVGHAIDSGELVARNLLGAEEIYRPQPWFWSDQYDCRLQIAGLSQPGDEVVTRESPAEGRSHWYFREDRLVAVDALHAPQAFAIGRRLLALGHTPDRLSLSDPGTALRSLLPPAPGRASAA